jgi:hypothetical protein
VAIAAPAPVVISSTEIALVAGLLFTIVLIRILDSLQTPTATLAGAVPLVGSALRRTVENAFTSAHNALHAALSAELVAFSRVLGVLQSLWVQFASTVVGFAQLSATATTRIVTFIIPRAVDLGLAQAEVLIADEATHAEQLAAAVSVEAQGLFAAAEARAAALVNAIQTADLQLIRDVEAQVVLSEARAVAVAESLAGLEHAFAVAGIKSAEGYADHLFAQAAAISAAAEASLRGDLGAVAELERRALASGVSALEKQIAEAQRILSTAALPAIAAIAVDVAAIKALECIKQCAPLGAVGQGLALLDLAAILALVEAAQADPQGTQRFLQATIVPVVEGLSSSVKGIV